MGYLQKDESSVDWSCIGSLGFTIAELLAKGMSVIFPENHRNVLGKFKIASQISG